MKIAYLMHYMKNNFEEITENLDILIPSLEVCTMNV